MSRQYSHSTNPDYKSTCLRLIDLGESAFLVSESDRSNRGVAASGSEPWIGSVFMLTPQERRVVLNCLRYIQQTDQLDASDFETRIGGTRRELGELIAQRSDDVDDWSLSERIIVNNCMNEVCNGLPVDWTLA